MRHPAFRYALAAAVVGLGCLLRWALPWILEDTPYLAFYPAVVAAAAIGGLGPGLLATVASFLCVDLLFDPTPWRVNLADPVVLGRLAAFCAGGIGISVIAGIRQVVQDRQRRQAAALCESEARFRGTFENAAVGIAHLDAQGRFLRINQRLREILGYWCEELRGRDFRDFTDPQTMEPDASQYARLMRGEIPKYTLEKCYLRKDRQPVWVSIARSLQRSSAGEPVYSIAIVQDISERKRAEQALRESETRYRTLFDSIDEGFCIVEVLFDGHGKPIDYRFLQANPSFETHTGLADVQGKTMRELVPKHEEYWFERYGDVALTGEPTRFQNRAEQLGRWYDVYAFRVDRPQERRVAILFSDITARKVVEEALHESRKGLQEVNQTLEQRVAQRTAEVEQRAAQLRALTTEITLAEHRERQRIAKVLHDHLQQLLVGARFNLATVQSQVADAALRQSLDQIHGLLDDSVQTSRSLTAELFPTVLREGTFAEALRWLIQWMREKHDLQVHARMDEQAHPQTDEVRLLLFDAVRELLFNIVKHAGVREASLELVCHNNNQVQITVADAGNGFDAASLRLVRRTEGGYGLFTIRERLQLLGGTVTLESTPGHGTRATLLAPLAT